MYNRSIYSVKTNSGPNGGTEGECLLAEFERGRNEHNHQKNTKRQEANLKMLVNDLEKFSFHPEYDLYSSGFDMNVKTELYRFPSILLLDLVIVMDLVGKDSWSTLDLFRQEYSQGFTEHLYSVLVFACFSRLRCYLAMDAHADSFKAGVDQAMPSGVEGSDQNLGFRMTSTWSMGRDEFFLLCKDLLSLQNHMKCQPIASMKDMEEMMSKSVREHTLAQAMAHYYCSEWSEFKNRLEGFYWPMDDQL